MINNTSTFFKVTFFILLSAVFSYYFLDIPVARGFRESHGLHILFWKRTTNFGLALPYIAVCGGFWYFYKDKKPEAARMALYILFAVALSGIAADIIKPLLARYRPSLLFSDNLYGFSYFHFKFDTNYLSFPSGHTATAFAVASMLGYYFKRYRYLAFLGAVLVGLSRIALTKHYISDVIIGAYVGMVSSMFLYYTYYKGGKKPDEGENI